MAKKKTHRSSPHPASSPAKPPQISTSPSPLSPPSSSPPLSAPPVALTGQHEAQVPGLKLVVDLDLKPSSQVPGMTSPPSAPIIEAASVPIQSNVAPLAASAVPLSKMSPHTETLSSPIPVSTRDSPSSSLTQPLAAPKLTWTDVVQGSGPSMSKKGTPFTLDSGELCVKIPNSVISKNARNWDNFILGQFHGKPPSPGTIHAILNGIWSNKLRDITISRLTDKGFLIRIPNPATRKRVLAQGVWHIDNQTMFVAKWEPGFSPVMPELSSVPVWLEFRNVPPQFFNIDGLEYIAGLLGDPKFLHPTTANMTNLEVARVFTVVHPLVPLPETINVQFEAGQFHRIEVSCPWLPPICSFCQEIGHSIKCCPTAPVTCSACNSTRHSTENCTRVKRKTTHRSKPSMKPSVEVWTRKVSSAAPVHASSEPIRKDQDGVNKVTKDTTLAGNLNTPQSRVTKVTKQPALAQNLRQPPTVGSPREKDQRSSAGKAHGIKISSPLRPAPPSASTYSGKGKAIASDHHYNSSDVAGNPSGYSSSESSDSDWISGEDDNLYDDENFVPYVSKKLMRQLRDLRKKQSPRGGGPKSHH